MGRGGRAFLQHWHWRSLDLGDGSKLRWLVIAAPGREPWIPCFSVDGEPVHETTGHRLLVEHGHADAELRTMTDTARPGLTH